MKNTVIFDLDGTLLDTLDDLGDGVNAALLHMGFPIRNKEEIRQFVGNGMHHLVTCAVPAGTTQERLEETYDFFCRYYLAHCREKTCPYAGIQAMLLTLVKQCYCLAVVSNKRTDAVEELCHVYFDGLISAVAGDSPGRARKPAPDGVEAVLAQMNRKKEDAIYVGDSEVDIATARNAGIDCISVTWGFRTENELRRSGASTLVSHPEELPDLLLRMRMAPKWRRI